MKSIIGLKTVILGLETYPSWFTYFPNFLEESSNFPTGPLRLRKESLQVRGVQFV